VVIRVLQNRRPVSVARPRAADRSAPGRSAALAPIATLVLAAALLMAGPVACTPERSERELAVAAAALASGGDPAAARAAFGSALEQYPNSVEIRIRLAEFLTAEGELAEAREVLDLVATMPAGDEESRRAAAVEREWFSTLLRNSRGETLLQPRDRDGYETAITRLLSREQDPELGNEWATYLMARAREAVLADPTRSIDMSSPSNAAALASPEQARAALDYLDRLLDGDDVVRQPLPMEPPFETEARAMRETLRGIVFGAEFDRTFADLHRPRMVDDGRYDLASDTFTLRYQGPVPVELPPEAGPDVLEQVAEAYIARELATDLAFELRGTTRGEAPPLEFDLADFRGTEAAGVARSDEGVLSFSIRIPYATVRRAAFLLQRRMDEEVARSMVPGESGDGSGAAPGTPAEE
jgi:hypothetical protein